MRYSSLVERIGAQDDGSGPEAWAIHSRASQAALRGEDVIVMSVGDPDFDTPVAVRAAAIRAIEGGDTHYTPILGKLALREAIARDHNQRSGAPCGPENVMVTSGAQTALFLASMCLAGPGDEVLALEPMYVTYAATIRASGATLTRAPMPAEGGFRPKRAAIEAAITSRTRAIFLATPNNPTGVMLDSDEIAMIAEIARAHDLWIVSDEIYSRIGFAREHLSMAAAPGVEDRLVVIDGLSKSHAMTGWRIGWAIAPEPLVEHFDNLGLCMLYGVAGFTQAAGLAALTEGLGAAEKMRRAYRRRRDVFVAAIQRARGLRCEAPEGGMFALVDVSQSGLGAEEFAGRLFETEGVSVLPGGAFGSSSAECVRVSFALSEERLAEACVRIARFVRGL